MQKLERHLAPLATLEQLQRVHSPDYIGILEAASRRAAAPGAAYLDPDTAMNRHSMKAALRAAGAVVLATDLVMEKKADNAFCSIRPPGHHADPGQAMGFCFINNIAVGVAHALEAHAVERVAVVDFDVHHGNGTENIFRDDARVMMVSIFQHPFYPYSGLDGRSDRMVNVPLPAGAGSDLFRSTVRKFWLPALDRFQPRMVFISAGFDAHRDDDLSALNLVEEDYAWVTGIIRDVARRFACNRVVSVLEGGYDLSALARSATAHLQALNDPCGPA
jgi:acetoin utilization deacetylase AcuC-like enzyme